MPTASEELMGLSSLTEQASPQAQAQPKLLNSEDLLRGADPISALEASRDTPPTQIPTQRRINQEVSEEEDFRTQSELLLEGSPTTAAWLVDPVNAAVGHEAVEELGTFERIANGWRRGQIQTEFGQAQFAAMGSDNPGLQARADEVHQRLEELGRDSGEGATAFFTSAANVVSQVLASINSPEAAARISAGGALGGTAGLAGGPFAPVTVFAGAVGGAGAGAVYNMTKEAFENEAAFSYSDLTDAGVDPDGALLGAYAVGTINAALEMTGAAVIAKPFALIGKKGLRRIIGDRLKTEEGRALALQFGKQYGTGIAAEVGTEVMQEVTNIVAQQMFALFDEEVESLTTDEIEERIADIAMETFQAMVVLAPIGPGANYVANKSEARAAQADKRVADEMSEAAAESSVRDHHPEAYASHVEAVLNDMGQTDVFIPAEKLRDYVQATGNVNLPRQLGVDVAMVDALVRGDDVRIPARQYASLILGTEHYAGLADHIRLRETGMTAAEAAEFDEASLDDQLFNTAAIPEEETTALSPEEEFQEQVDTDVEALLTATEEDIAAQTTVEDAALREAVRNLPPEATVPVDIAEAEMGLEAMFRTADEAGMTPKRYQEYLVEVQKKADKASIEMQDKLLKEQQRENTDQWKKELQQEEETARETLSQSQVWQAHQSIGVDQLDRAEVEAITESLDIDITSLPTQTRNRRVYTNKGKKGISVDDHAQIHGYRDAEEMILDWATVQPFQEDVDAKANQAMLEKHGTLLDRQQALIEARQALHNDSQEKVLLMELNQLRSEKKAGRVSAKAIRAAAKEQMARMPVRDISANKFLAAERRKAREASRSLRKGDRGQAADHKFQQVMNFEMAKLAEKVNAKLAKQERFLKKLANPNRKLTSNIPTPYQKALKELLELSGFVRTRDLSNKSLKEVANREVDPVTVPKVVQNKATTPWRSLTLREFTDLHDTAKAIEKAGRDANRLRLKTEKRERDVIVAVIIDEIQTNLAEKDPLPTRNMWDSSRRFGRDVLGVVLDADTILRDTDGFADLGPTWSNIKGRIDKAHNKGYAPGDIGLIRRNKKVAKDLNKLQGIYTEKERRALNKRMKIEGWDGRPITKNQQLSAVLNMGNPEGRDSLSNQFSEDQIALLAQNLTAKDAQFIQSVWDYLDTYWVEIRTKEEARRNFTPEKVENIAVETNRGTLTGGYYPLRYDKNQSYSDYNDEMDVLVQELRQGYFASNHTARGHTEARTRGHGKNLLLDLGVMNRHLSQVVYDLEMGDAIADAYKIWHDPDLQKAYREQGFGHYWESVNLNLRDTITGEMYSSGALEGTFRFLRAGFTASKLAWNIKTILIQPLGIVSTAVQVGKFNTLLAMARSTKPGIGKWMNELSPFMSDRSQNHNIDINLAQGFIRDSFLKKILPARWAEYVSVSAFYGIKKMQRVADRITWVASYKKGMQKFKNDQEKAVEFADLMVSRTQGSAIFHQRTSLERGTLGKKFQQSDFVRAWTPFMNYFIKKNNVAFERIKKANLRNPLEMADVAADLMLLYVFEGTILAMIAGQLPDDEEDSTLGFVLGEAATALAAGIPIVREFASGIRGFSGGGIVGSVSEDLKKLNGGLEEFGETGELPFTGLGQAKSEEGIINILGFFTRWPAAQINRFRRASLAAEEGQDVELWEYAFGPRYEE